MREGREELLAGFKRALFNLAAEACRAALRCRGCSRPHALLPRATLAGVLGVGVEDALQAPERNDHILPRERQRQREMVETERWLRERWLRERWLRERERDGNDAVKSRKGGTKQTSWPGVVRRRLSWPLRIFSSFRARALLAGVGGCSRRLPSDAIFPQGQLPRHGHGTREEKQGRAL